MAVAQHPRVAGEQPVRAAAAVTWHALIGGPAQLAGVLAWLLCHGRQSASLSLAEGARESFVVVG